MDMGGTGLRDDGSTGAHAAHEDGDMNSAPPDAYGHRNIPSGLIDDGSHNPSLSGEVYQGRKILMQVLGPQALHSTPSSDVSLQSHVFLICLRNT